MNRLFNLLNSTIGRKLVVALSGIILLLFVIGHAVGNLTIYIGSSAINGYAHWLQNSPMLWFVRLAMLAIVIGHIWLGVRVTLENSRARNISYAAGQTRFKRIIERYMAISGLLILLFILGHIAQMTLGLGADDTFYRVDELGYLDVYARVIFSFQNPLIAYSYIAAMLLLGIHLKHSVRALFQTLGLFHDNYFSFYELVSWLITLFVVIVLCSIPIAVQLGLLDLPTLSFISDQSCISLWRMS